MRSKLFQQALEQVPEHTHVFVRLYGDIIDRIHDLMEEKGYLQKDLANLLDKKESEISKWLKGDHNLTLRTIAKLQVALGEEIISVPKKSENIQFIGWRKSTKGNMSFHRSHNDYISNYQVAEFKAISAESHQTVAAL